MQIKEVYFTDEGMGPVAFTYEDACRITAEHGFPTRPQRWFQVGSSHYPRREDAEKRLAYINAMSMGG